MIIIYATNIKMQQPTKTPPSFRVDMYRKINNVANVDDDDDDADENVDG